MSAPRVLFVTGGALDYGGISSCLLGYLAHIPAERLAADFLVNGMEPGPREKEALARGCRVFHLPYKREDLAANRAGMLARFASGEYDIVHANNDAMNFEVLSLARRVGIKARVSHVHNTGVLSNNPVKIAYHRLCGRRIPSVATRLFACSEAAGRYFYGNRPVDGGRLTVIQNAIELERFAFDLNARARLRAELGLSDAFAVLHAGRFEDQKNHLFLLDAFALFAARCPNAVLLLAGDGRLRPEIERAVREKGLDARVRLLGFRGDVPSLMSAADLFVLPSRFEGLGIVLVEAQAAGLACLASNAVPRDAAVADCRFLPLSAPRWAEEMDACRALPRSEASRARFALAGYDIKREAGKLAALYEDCLP